MQELIAIIVLLLALATVIVGYNMSKTPILPPPIASVSQPIQPQVVPIYFPRPIYPYPRLGFPVRKFSPVMRQPIRH